MDVYNTLVQEFTWKCTTRRFKRSKWRFKSSRRFVQHVGPREGVQHVGPIVHVEVYNTMVQEVHVVVYNTFVQEFTWMRCRRCTKSRFNGPRGGLQKVGFTYNTWVERSTWRCTTRRSKRSACKCTASGFKRFTWRCTTHRVHMEV